MWWSILTPDQWQILGGVCFMLELLLVGVLVGDTFGEDI